MGGRVVEVSLTFHSAKSLASPFSATYSSESFTPPPCHTPRRGRWSGPLVAELLQVLALLIRCCGYVPPPLAFKVCARCVATVAHLAGAILHAFEVQVSQAAVRRPLGHPEVVRATALVREAPVGKLSGGERAARCYLSGPRGMIQYHKHPPHYTCVRGLDRFMILFFLVTSARAARPCRRCR
jgi:hypothetical protein